MAADRTATTTNTFQPNDAEHQEPAHDEHGIPPGRRRDVAPRNGIHEAGHAVAAVSLGGRVHLATIDEDDPRTEFVSIPAGREAEVTYAGPWTEARWSLRRAPDPADIRRVLAGQQP